MSDLITEVERAASSLITEAANQRRVHRNPILADRLDAIALRLVDAITEDRRMEATDA